jgi:hypothetical protein
MKKFIAVAGVLLAVVREIDGIGITWLEAFADRKAYLKPETRRHSRRSAEISLVDARIIRGRPPLKGGGVRRASRPRAARTLRPIRN